MQDKITTQTQLIYPLKMRQNITAANKNCTAEKIKSKLNSGNAHYDFSFVSSLLSND
jgi:hypothetical protein